MEEREYEPTWGGTVHDAVFNARRFAQIHSCISVMDFNGIELKIFSDSRVGDICTIYNLKHELRRKK